MSFTFGRFSHDTPSLRGLNVDSDGALPPNDCNTDVGSGSDATHFDGGEDVDGDGYYGHFASYAPPEMYSGVTPAIDTDPYNPGDGNTRVWLAGLDPYYHEDSVDV